MSACAPGPTAPAPPAAWAGLPFWQDEWPALQARLAADRRQILPAPGDWFTALALTPPEAVRVVILGQDPYPTPGHAHGLAFSVAPGTALPRSLANIYRELADDIGGTPGTGDLRPWARQGVLLLNTALTVPAGEAGGHGRIGWDALTTQVLGTVLSRPTALLLWGAKAQALLPEDRCAGGGHLRLASAHPSPLSARRGFFGSRPFSRINEWLASRGETPIVWADPQPEAT